MRCHVAGHILNKDILFNPHLCGFCGLTKVACKVELRQSSGFGKNKTISSFSKCSYFYDLSIASASRMSKNDPCTNRPIECTLCPDKSVFWSYNLKSHYEHDHHSLNCPIIISSEEKNKVLEKLKHHKKIKK